MEILDLLHPRDILLRDPAQAKRPLLGAIARQLSSRTGLSFVSVLSALLDREKLGATYIGQGIGLPHAMLERLREPAAVLAILQQPIPYHTPHEQSVDVVLGVVWPREGATDFLNALARFCRQRSQPQVLKKVRGAASAEEVLAHLSRPMDAAPLSIPGLSSLQPRAQAAERWGWR
ncbi:MAG: PTS sugar transporter subunit IIA [Neoaquamicrobium sediminum]|uniref:PTS sugar transporter subunit IIA n=1 Tax=Neoaquamicrobium sediminum TaxID=1849104 RepID=UPI004037310B